MRAIGLALVGASIELGQLLLVLVAAILGAELFARPASPGDVLRALLFFVGYSLFTLLPARDLVQGWLGMIAGRRPARYAERGENLGRGLVALAAGAVLVLLAVVAMPLMPAHDPPEARALGAGFFGLALAVFGFGTAVPRLWFAFRREPSSASSATSPEEVPALLAEAGRRGARLILCAFLGIGLGLAAASATRGRSVWPVAARWRREQFTGALCRTPTPDCPHERHAVVRAPATARVDISTVAYVDPPRCTIVPVGAWPPAEADRDALVTRLASAGDGGPVTVSVAAGARVALDVVLPAGAERCTYFLDLAAAGPAGDASHAGHPEPAGPAGELER